MASRRGSMCSWRCVRLRLRSFGVNVSINVGRPNFYGRIDIGDFPPPVLIDRRPIIIRHAALRQEHCKIAHPCSDSAQSMSTPTGLNCIRCGAAFPLTAYRNGCVACSRDGVAANLTVTYGARTSLRSRELPRTPRSMWRYDALLHATAGEAVSLGEGNTPLVPVDRLGLGPLWLKDESRNPTWSFKDRLASAAVTMAKKLGATVIASSSSGNAGAASAAYAARAGLPCVIVTYKAAAGPMLTQMRAAGAMLLTVPESADRWRVLRVRRRTPASPVRARIRRRSGP